MSAQVDLPSHSFTVILLWMMCTRFDRSFGGDALLGVTGGTSAMLEPLI
ncbi:hypothetical protein H6F46_16895 [Limnothrix sp. FACHB-1083]|nr:MULTISPECIES: hypothetical protein [unclassified Limnothrix]MBD2162369.1 hypothetical protein [Limnothrix sp. FACHB-1083]MBD2193406.1 hypothetical protein [Limnothrix sp. FACHB-1088]